MKKTTIAIIMGMFLISLVSSVNVGETINYDFSNKVDSINSLNYSVINGSNEWFDVSFSDSIVSITPNELLETGDYSIELSINGEKYVVSSGGSRTKYYKWECSKWSECKDGYRNRTCNKVRVYYRNYLGDKPNEFISCYVKKENKTDNKIDENKSDTINIINEEKPQKLEVRHFIIVALIFVGGVFLYLLLVEFISRIIKQKKIKFAKKRKIYKQ